MTQILLCDYATPLDPRDVKAAGYVGVLRYIAPPDAKYDWKRLTLPERDAIWAQGLGILPVFESYAGAREEGAAAGRADANAMLWELHQLGWPGGLPAFMADDTDTTADQVRPYFQAAAQVTADAGVYGGIKVTDPLLADGTVRWAWQACAWSNNQVSTTAHLYQRLRPTTALAGSFDEDVLLRPLPLWIGPGAVVAPPTPIPAPAPANPIPPDPQIRSGGPGMFIWQVTDGPYKNWEIYDFGYGPVHIDGPTAAALAAAPNPVPVKPIPGAVFTQQFPTLARQ